MSILLAALAAAVIADQEPKSEAAKPEDNKVEAVVVTGAAQAVQTSIDRRSYSLGKDLQASTGTIGDALRNLPGVNVDLQGGLTLRGDANVTILVDGKPAGQFEGSNRADALQQLSADQYERVEVITNPSAAMNPDGSGGIINLISKTSRGAGWTRSAYVTAGSAGLKRAGFNFGYNTKRLGVTGSLTQGYQRNKGWLHDLRRLYNPDVDAFEDHFVDSTGRNLTRTPTANLNLTYELTPKDRLTGALMLSAMDIAGHPTSRYEDRDASGAVIGLLSRQADRQLDRSDANLSSGWRHSFAGEGHSLSIDLISNRRHFDDGNLQDALESLPPLIDRLEHNTIVATERHSEARAVYVRPTPGGGKLTTGYELKFDHNNYDQQTARGPDLAGLAPVDLLRFTYDYRLLVNAAYATFERPFGDLTLQAGLRLEDARLDLRDPATGAHSEPDYFRAFPTLHLSYRLNEQSKLTAAYSERIQRPPGFLLTPSNVYVDPKNFQRGNPNLKPQETQSFELGWERRKGPSLQSATGYYRQNKGEFSLVLNDQGDGVILVTFDNLGSSTSAGLELVANGALSTTLTYTANASLYRNEISAANLGFGERSVSDITARVNLNWQARPNDLLQVNLSRQGRQIVAQGDIRPNFTMNLGWRHKLTDRLTATVSAQDVLYTNRFRRTFDTPTIISRFENRQVSRALLVRLDYRFGGGAPKAGAEPGFDYNGGGAP